VRIVKVVCVLVGCTIIGAVAGFVIAGFLLPPDPTGRGAPGDGFLIIWCAGAGLVISAVVAIFVAVRIIWRPAKAECCSSLYRIRLLAGARKTMKLVRSNSQEIVQSIATAGACASRNWYTLGFACAANVLALFIAAAVSVGVSVRAAAWLSMPVLVALNGYVLWRAQASHRRWVIVGCADRVYVRLFPWRSGGHSQAHEPDVLVVEAREIASMSIRTVEVFLYGPKPRIVEWLVIEPAQTLADAISGSVRPLLTRMEPDKAVLAVHEKGHLTIEWKWWRPPLRVFLQQLVQECPSVVIAPEERSELDLNGIWRGISLNLEQQKRELLVRAMRLGFGCECKRLLSRYKYISYQKAAAYLAEIEREEAGTGDSAVQSGCGCGGGG